MVARPDRGVRAAQERQGHGGWADVRLYRARGSVVRCVDRASRLPNPASGDGESELRRIFEREDFGATPGALSVMVPCEDQDEIDRHWTALSAVPEAEQCRSRGAAQGLRREGCVTCHLITRMPRDARGLSRDCRALRG